MANRAFVSLWTRDFQEETMLEQFERLLGTIPFSAARPGYTEFVIHAVDPSETVLIELDLRGQGVAATAVVALAREHQHADSSYEIHAHWDLCEYDLAASCWAVRPQPMEILCHGTDYDSGVCAELGHFQVDIGFEHLFTGHGGLLGARAGAAAAPQHPDEAAFLTAMASPGNLREYHQETRKNIERLMDWLRAVEEALPVERLRLWSEGEEDFEARLDEILAVR